MMMMMMMMMMFVLVIIIQPTTSITLDDGMTPRSCYDCTCCARFVQLRNLQIALRSFEIANAQFATSWPRPDAKPNFDPRTIAEVCSSATCKILRNSTKCTQRTYTNELCMFEVIVQRLSDLLHSYCVRQRFGGSISGRKFQDARHVFHN